MAQRDERLIEAALADLQRRSMAVSMFDPGIFRGRLLQTLREKREVGTTLAMVKAAKIKKVLGAELGVEPSSPPSGPSRTTLFGPAAQLLSALRRRLNR